MDMERPQGALVGSAVIKAKNDAQVTATMTRARELHERGHFDEAARHYEAVLAERPDDAEALHLYGVVQYQRGRPDESEDLLRRAVALAADPMSFANLGAVLAAAGRGDEALAQFDHALRIDSRHLHTLVRRANTLVELGRHEEALASYDRSLTLSPLLLDALCNRGAALRALGRHQEALESYDRALTVDPQSYESFFNRGHVLRDLQRAGEAIQSYDRAIALAPDNPTLLSTRGRSLAELGRLGEALTSFNEALAIEPDRVDALYNSAVVLERLGRPGEAIQRCERVFALQPGHSLSLACRGNAYLQLQRFDDALSSYRRALEIEPASSEWLCNQGTALRHLGRFDEALRSYDAALAVNADFAEAVANRGNVLQDLARYEEAIVAIDRAIALQPAHALHRFNRGNMLCAMIRRDRTTQTDKAAETRRHDEAMQNYDAALALDGKLVDAWVNRATALQDRHRYDEALYALDRSIDIRPDYAVSWFNRGNVQYEMSRPEAALRDYDRAIAIEPGFVDAHFARAALHLVRGDFPKGWEEYEWRLRDPRTGSNARVFSQPMWRGDEPLDGKTLLIHAEQGLGDTLQFCRYAELVHQRGARVILEVQPALKPLLETLRHPVQVVAAGDPLPAFDLHCPLLSLPFAFRTELRSIPACTPYLYADAARVERWHERLGPKRQPRIGLVWSGNAGHRNDRNRSIELAELAPLLALDVDWISLQKDVRARDAALLVNSPIRSFNVLLGDFADTAALVQSLDRVIVVDTSVAHLAGALGRPVWILLADPPEWRWMQGRDDSPWYPGARLFRQSKPGQWQDVVEALQAAIGTLA